MAEISTVFANFLEPGTRVIESTGGYRTLEIASHTAAYMIGTSSTGSFHTPTLCNSLTDFKNQFGGSASEAAVKMLFRNDPRSILYFVRAAIAQQFQITITTPVAGPYTVAINGSSVTATAIASDTRQQIVTKLIDAINTATIGATVTARPGPGTDQLTIRPDVSTLPLVVTVDVGAATALETTPTAAVQGDYVSAIESSFDIDDEWPQGFIFAPEAFQRLTSQTDRLAVGSAMHALASDENYDWAAIIDCGPGTDTVAKAQTDGQQYIAPQGHAAYYAPYLIDTEGDTVPPSPAIVGFATASFKERGYHQPYAGKAPLKGVVGLTTNFGRAEQSILNPLGINLVRNLRRQGIVIWGMRTRSQEPLYRFVHHRVIMNVLNGTLRNGFDSEIFSAIDGFGIMLARFEETARAVCRRMWQGRAFFGQSAAEAFEVKCDFENNPVTDLEAGGVLLQVFAAPSPAVEKLLINTVRVGIGQVQTVAASGQIQA